MRATQRLSIYKAMKKSLKKDIIKGRDSWEHTGFCVFLAGYNLFRAIEIEELTELYDIRTTSRPYWYQKRLVQPRLVLVERAIEEVKKKIWYYKLWNKIKQ